MVQGVRTAAQVEKLLRGAARRARKGWKVVELRGRNGRPRGKGSHKMVGLFDKDGIELCRTTIPQHPGDLAPAVAREIEATFEPHFGKGWMGT